jgi:CheY-like chemotaxis protein
MRISELESALVAWRRARDSALAQINSFAARIHASEARVDELTDEFEHAQQERDDAVKALDVARKDCDVARSLLESRDEAHAATVSRLQTELLNTKIAQAARADEKPLKAALERVKTLEAHIVRLQQQQKQASTSLIETTMQAHRERDTAIEEVKALRAEHERRSGEIASMRTELAESKRHLAHLEEVMANNAARNNDLECERLRRQNAEWTTLLHAARDEVRLAWAVTSAAKAPPAEIGESEEIPEPELSPLEGDDARAVVDDMREVLHQAIASDEPEQFLTILSNQLREYGRRSLCAGSVAAHRVAGGCLDVVKWVAKSADKMARASSSLEGGLTVLHAIAGYRQACVHADISDASVYVVDDDMDNCECIAMSLDKLGLRTHYASKAALAIDHLESRACELVVLDVDLGEANGFDLHKQIRRMPYHGQTPVLFLSGMASAEAEVKKLDPTKDAYLSKPYNLSELGLRVVCMVLEARMSSGV